MESVTRDRLFGFVHVTGHVCWWIFVVATLFPATKSSGPPDNGYIPSDGSCTAGPVVFLAFMVLIIAAAVEAAAVGRLIPGLITVGTPFIAAIVIWSVLPGDCGGNADLGELSALAIVLLAVAAREIWARVFAPHPST